MWIKTIRIVCSDQHTISIGWRNLGSGREAADEFSRGVSTHGKPENYIRRRVSDG